MPLGFHDDECGSNANKFDILKESEAICEQKKLIPKFFELTFELCAHFLLLSIINKSLGIREFSMQNTLFYIEFITFETNSE